jgi:UDP-4-amino-4,6-dideoxy-N-acetyl-beta-L-altrosamine transaminase
MKPIPYGRQNITAEDIEAVTSVLQSDFLTQGPEIEQFEKNFSQYIGCEFATAVSNGTAALHLAVLALGVKPGQKVITTPITFSASANCVLYAGGSIDFVDIDPDTYLINLEGTRKKLESQPKGTFAGLILVDFAGLPVDTEAFRSLADEHGLWIIEDACHAPGTSYLDSRGEKITPGDGQYADMSIFSFHPVKHIAAGEGGMITTNEASLYHKVKDLRTHGITKDPKRMKQNHGGWYYEMHELGYNYRLTDIQAALGNSQLKRAEENIKIRQSIAVKYDHAFAKLPIKTQHIPNGYHNAYHLYVIETSQRRELYDFLREKEIYAQVHYIPIHLLPYYSNLGWKKGSLPHAEEYYEKCLSLPMYPSMTEHQQNYVVECIEEFFT